MIRTLQQILESALEHLSYQTTTYLPPLLAALTILLAAYILARFARWLLTRSFRGIAFDRFLRESGLSSMLDRTGRIKGSRLVAGAAYWIILLIGILTGLSAFGTKLTSQIVEGTINLFPKLVTAAGILLAGAWLAQYLGRSVLVWAVNEEIPFPRRLAAAVRIPILFLSVVVAADALDFARNVFLAVLVIFAGGVALAASLALGLGGRDAVQRYLKEREQHSTDEQEGSLWKHL
jgi:flagellar biosynthesis protein FliQ